MLGTMVTPSTSWKERRGPLLPLVCVLSFPCMTDDLTLTGFQELRLVE